MKIAVIGSINTDFVYKVDKVPNKGETVFGEEYKILNGGKGANQCVILSALEKDVVFLGAVGTDVFGSNSLDYYSSLGLNENIVVKDVSTGLAVIQLSDGDNSITVIKGANDEITRDDVDEFFRKHQSIDVIVSQLEICLDTIEYLLKKAFEKGVKIILNPAPAMKLKEEIINLVDYLIPNEIEARLIFNTDDLESIVRKYKGKVIVTIGEKGVMYYENQMVKTMPSLKFVLVDTTGAGDSFVAGFTSGIANQLSLSGAVKKGIEIASITCQHMGAQSAYKYIVSKK